MIIIVDDDSMIDLSLFNRIEIICFEAFDIDIYFLNPKEGQLINIYACNNNITLHYYFEEFYILSEKNMIEILFQNNAFYVL